MYVGCGRLSPYKKIPDLVPKDYRSMYSQGLVAKIKSQIKVGNRCWLKVEAFDERGNVTTEYRDFEIVAIFPHFVQCRRKYSKRDGYANHCFGYMELAQMLLSEKYKEDLARRLTTDK